MSDNTLTLVLLAILLLLFGYVSEMDYQTQSATACERKGGEWDRESHLCIKEIRNDR